MKKSVIILIAIMLVSNNLHSQSNEPETAEIAIINFLIKHCQFHDGNPTRQEDADEVNLFARKIFEKQYTSDSTPNLITQALQLFYDNSEGEFEDAYDYTRMTTRRSMCYMALAFLSGEYRYRAFLEDARDNLNKLASDLNGQMLLIVNMIELYKELNSKYALKKEIERIILKYQDELKNMEEDFGHKELIEDYKKVLTDVANTIK